MKKKQRPKLKGLRTTISWSQKQLPLEVVYAGTSVWKPNVIVKRKMETVFGIGIVTAGSMVLHRDTHRLLEAGDICLRQPGHPLTIKTGPDGSATRRYISLTGNCLQPLITAFGKII